MIAEKSLNLFDDCAARCVYLFLQEEERTSSSYGDSKMYTTGTIGNSQVIPTEINKNGAILKERVLK